MESIRMIGPQELAARLLATRVGRPVGTFAYEVVIASAARAFGSVDGVVGVYLTGSAAHHDPDFLPGRSDVDLVVVIDATRGLDAELAMRDAIDRRLRALRFGTRIVQTLDVIEARDIPLLQRHGDEWSFDLATRWRHLAGEYETNTVPARAHAERRMLLLMKALRRWFKASPVLLGAREGELHAGMARAAERLLAFCLAAVADVPPATPLEKLLASSRTNPMLTDALRAWDRDDATRPRTSLVDRTDRALAFALAAIDTLVLEVTRTWTPRAPAPRGTYMRPNTPDVAASVDAAARTGFVSMHSVARNAGELDHVLLAVAPADMTPSDMIARGRQLARIAPSLESSGCLWASRPVLITQTMARASFLFDTAPFAFDSLQHEVSCLHGTTFPLLVPERTLRDALLRAKRALLLIRARSRRFHGTSSVRALAAFETEVFDVVRPLRTHSDQSGIVFGPSSAEGRGERECLSVLCDELEFVRAALRAIA